jgi:hypothetical protein
MTIRPASRQPSAPESSGEQITALVALVYELLDAHADTARLDADAASDADWANHLAYLRDLQRVGRETLAGVAPGASG